MKLLLITLFIFTIGAGYAQEQMDSVMLDEVVFTASKFIKYSSGAKVVKLKIDNSTSNLNDAMLHLPSITFKNYGNGGLSTIAFRGTSAQHTQLIWNGIPVNSPTLGQSDFSLFPVFMMDQISVQYGSTSALTGSGAIGGTVSMGHASPDFSNGIRANVALSMGSFGRYFTGVKTQYGNTRFQGKTKLYRRSIRNDFPFPEKGSDRTLTQENAAIGSYGVEQQLHARLSNTQQLSIIGFYNFNHREIQPNVASTGNNEILQDDNTRVVADYRNHSKTGFWQAKIGYVLNDQLYNKTSRVKSAQWSSILDWDRSIGSNTSVRAGVAHHYFVPKTKSHTVDAKENRTELYTSIKQKVSKKWEMSLNLRQAFYDGELAPFTPSLGQEYLVRLGGSKLILKNRFGRSYRVPTLNDRFWIQGGNPDLKPEDGWNIEIGGEWLKDWKTHSLSVEATAYNQNVDNWIQWSPNEVSIWTPENIQQVDIKGVELVTKYSIRKAKHVIDFIANYSLTRSIIRKDIDSDFVNNFLPYVAQHNASFSANWKVTNWSNTLSTNYVGRRFIEKSNDEFQAIEGFVLINYKVGKKITLQKINMSLSIEVNNILNIYYEQLKNHAMAGRNYAINLSINI